MWNWSLSHLPVLLLYNLFAINTSYVIDDIGRDTCTMLLPISGAPSFYIKKPHTTHDSSTCPEEGVMLVSFRVSLLWLINISIISSADKKKLSFNTPIKVAPQFFL